MIDLDPVSPEPKFSPETKDILALEARIKQLEGALGSFISRVKGSLEYCENGVMPGVAVNLLRELVWREKPTALAAPTPDVSPLWEILRLEVRFWDDKKSGEWEATSKKLNEAVKALTPDLRALIEAQASKEGQGV